MWKHRPNFISLILQSRELVKYFPDSRARIKCDELSWVGELTPSALSTPYRVRLRYRIGKRPRVEVLNPPLQQRDGKMPPHLYPDGTLCLYMPRNYEWTREMYLVETILPWASEWLLHYEVWLATGEWQGGGEHPTTTPTRGRLAHISH